MNNINITQIINLYYGNIYDNEEYMRGIFGYLDEPTFLYLRNFNYMAADYLSKKEREILQQAIIGLIDE